MSSHETAEDYKALGNEAFSKKEFEVAIEHYTKAIQRDSKNHVFFSNRSASYAGLGQWEKAVDDAKECIRLDPQFMKGYYRLATAQLELEDFDMALKTVKQGLVLDANNAPLLKVMRSIKSSKKAKMTSLMTATKKNASSAGGALGSGAGVGLDSAASEELRDLQIQISETSREYNKVKANLNMYQREQRMSQLTLDELEKYASTTSSSDSNKTDDGAAAVSTSGGGAYYRSVGKMFMKHSRDDIFDHLKSRMEAQSKGEEDLTQKLTFLEKRLQSQQQNVNELTSSSTTARVAA